MSNKNPLYIGFFLLLLWASSVHAQPQLQFPLSCALGQDCFFVNYVDVDASDKAVDFTCGPRTYDDHQGTDIGLKDRVSMEKGVDVMAAAPGTVLRVRDEIEDKQPSADEMASMLAANKGCGNGILVDNGDGWQTIYCHLKQGSTAVKTGQTIKAGDKIAQAGQSGAAEFPHLHLGVFFEGHTIDPFSGFHSTPSCKNSRKPLWAKDIPYSPVSLYAAGFTSNAPDFEALKINSSTPDTLPTAAPALVFWTGLYGVIQGDEIKIEIRDPAGEIFASRESMQDKTRARQFYYIGRRTPKEGLSSGTYTGKLSWKRGEEERTIEKRITIQ